jgi:hypothetical protein
VERRAKDPDGAAKALQVVIEQEIRALPRGAAGRAGMQPVPSAPVQLFMFFDAHTGQDVVAWRILCCRPVPEQTH